MARIIIADDDKLIHKIYAKIIEYLGHEIVKCYNGLEAVQAVEKESVDLIILDNKMPEMDGYEACRTIRKLPNGITTPIIIVSADDSQASVLKFLNAGANDYLLKPVSEPILIAKLKTFLKTASLHKNELEIVREKVTIADQYKIQKVLGYGAHSVVFLANDQKNNDRKVAVKLLNQNVVSEDLIEPITELLLKLQTAELENVIEVFDYGQYGGNFYIVLEYADGGDFAAQLKQQGRLSEENIVKVGSDIAKALISLQKHNICHLDIKPENIMIHDGVYKLSDFGIVAQRATTTMALNTEIWGTPAYSSPEILMDNENVSIKSDIYSFGVTLYEGVIGDNPFLSDKPSVSMFRQLNLQPPSLLDMEGSFSIEISVLIDMMLSKVPSQRPDPAELGKTFAYIEQCLGSESEQQLTYFKKQKKPVIEKTDLQVNEKADEVDDAVNVFSKATNVSLHTKGWKRAVVKTEPSVKPVHNLSNLKRVFLKVALAVIVFSAIYSATQAVSLLFDETKPEYDFKGTPSMVICEKCGNREETPVIDIRDSKCSKCGGDNWYAIYCNNCRKFFPLNENKFNDDDLSTESFDAELAKLYVCPFCQSSDTDEVIIDSKAGKQNVNK